MATFSRPRFSACALVLALALAGCSDDGDDTAGGTPDTTPPSITGVTAVDAFHVDVTFGEDLQRDSAEQEENYVIVETTVAFAAKPGAGAPGDTLRVVAASLRSDRRTVGLTTESQGAVPYELSVSGVADASGNEITTAAVSSFPGSTGADDTAPEIVARSPAPNATGVAVGQSIVVQFSEPVTYISVAGTFVWEAEDGSHVVTFNVDTEDAVEFTVTPNAALENGTRYEVTVGPVEDAFGNQMPVTSWIYTTTPNADNTPPALVSSVPANLATHVDVNTNLTLTFSEAIYQGEMDIQLAPDPGDGTVAWSNAGKTLTFDPDLPLTDDTQYNLTILPDGIRDLAGNSNALPFSVKFTTGTYLEAGSFAGTISGDPGSDFADDPTGGLVAAPDRFPFSDDDFQLLGTGVVATNNTYDIRYLPDDVYYPIVVMNTNGDDHIDPSDGDAIGAYGVDIRGGDLEPDSVTIVSGNRVTGVNFPMFDPSAIAGTVVYDGAYSSGNYMVGVGAFDDPVFNPSNVPDFATFAYWPSDPTFRMNTLDDGVTEGTYFVGAFLDVNGNGDYDIGMEPAGAHGGLTSPTSVTLNNGSDAVGLVIVIQDPPLAASPAAAASVSWPSSARRAPWLEKLSVELRRHENAARITLGR